MMTETALSRALRLAFSGGMAAALGVLAQPALAQEASAVEKTEKAEKTEKIVVTGSNIKRATIEGPSPVQVISRADIEQSGAKSAAELLETLSSNNNTGAQYRSTNTNNTTPGASAASLRGLGPNSTLVLLNGRRIAFYGFADGSTFVDLDTIPFAAIERVEIVKDGASAIYGADALGGVINFILRKSYQGVEVSAKVAGSQTYHDMASQSLTLTGGVNNSSGLNLIGVADYFKRDHVMQSARPQTYKDFTDRALAAGYALTNQNKNGVPYFNRLTTFSSTGNFWGPNPNNRGANEYWANRPCAAPDQVYSGPLQGLIANKACLADSSRYFTYVPGEERFSSVGRATYDISDTLSVFAELSYSHSKMEYDYFPIGTGSMGTWFDAGTYGAPRAATAAWGGVYYRAIYPELGLLHRSIKNDSGRVLAGAKGTLGKWDWESALGMSSTKTNMQGSNYLNKKAWLLHDGTHAGNAVIDAFNPLSATDRALLNAPHTRDGKSEFTFWDAKVSGEIATLPAGPVMLAAGVALLHEKMSDGVDAATVKGDVSGGYVRAPISDSRSSRAVYGELSVPLHRTMEMQLALRNDHYSDFGGSTNPKLALRWQPVEMLMLRASYSTGFRAPSIPEMNGGSESWGTDPTLNTNRWQSTAKFRYLDAKDLKPEKSESQNIGFVIEPVKNFSVGVDFWSVLRKDQVYTPSIINDRDKLIATIPETAALPTIYVFKNINLGHTKVRGVDIDIKGRMALKEWGQLNFSSVLSNTTKYETKDSSGTRQWGSTYGYAPWKSVTTLGWTRGTWYAGLTANHRSGFAANVQNAAQNIQIGSFTTYDLHATWSGLRKNVRLGAGVKNLGATKPPFVLDSGIGQAWEDDGHGRQVYLSLNYKF